MLKAVGKQTFATSLKIFLHIIAASWRLHHFFYVASCVSVISEEEQKTPASHQMFFSWHSNKEPHRITNSTRWGGKSDLLVLGAQSNTFSPSQGNWLSLCLPLRCEITTQWEESLSEKHFYDSFGGAALHPALAVLAHTLLFQSVHCEKKRVPASLNSSHRQQSHDCQFHAWLIVITLRETKKGERNAFRD